MGIGRRGMRRGRMYRPGVLQGHHVCEYLLRLPRRQSNSRPNKERRGMRRGRMYRPGVLQGCHVCGYHPRLHNSQFRSQPIIGRRGMRRGRMCRRQVLQGPAVDVCESRPPCGEGVSDPDQALTECGEVACTDEKCCKAIPTCASTTVACDVNFVPDPDQDGTECGEVACDNEKCCKAQQWTCAVPDHGDCEAGKVRDDTQNGTECGAAACTDTQCCKDKKDSGALPSAPLAGMLVALCLHVGSAFA